MSKVPTDQRHILMQFAEQLRHNLNRMQVEALKDDIYMFYVDYYTNEVKALDVMKRIQNTLRTTLGSPIQTMDIVSTTDIEDRALNDITEAQKPSWLSRWKWVIIGIVLLLIVLAIGIYLWRRSYKTTDSAVNNGVDDNDDSYRIYL